MRTTIRSTAIFMTLALAACSGGGSSVPPPIGGALIPQTPIVPQANSTGIAYGAEALKGAAYRGAAKLGTVDIGVFVKPRDAAGLLAYARAVSDPHSGSYRRFLTPGEIADRFGASAEDYTKVEKYFSGHHLAIMGWKQRELLRVRGQQANMEAALGAKFVDYTRNGRLFHSLSNGPSALTALPITALLGTTNYARMTQKPLKLHSAPAQNGYSPQTIAAGFDYTGAYDAAPRGFTGAGVTVGIIGTGPIDTVDLTNFKRIYHVAGASTVTQVAVTNANAPLLQPPLTFAAPPATTDNCNVPATGPDAACNPEDGEAQLDTQQVATLARDATVLFYLAYAPNADGTGDNYEGIDLVDYEVQQAIQDNRVDIISMSYGIGEPDDVGGDFVLGTNGQVNPTQSIGPVQFATLTAMGVASFASSGDNGALGCSGDQVAATENDLCVSYPATDENVVAVGGVNAPLAANGRFTGPITGWGIQTGFGASGGGISDYFPIPAYQLGASGVSGSTRNTPDISLVGDLFTGVAVAVDTRYPDGGIIPVGGTSVAAPEAAAMWAIAVQACYSNPLNPMCEGGTGGAPDAYRLGNPNPVFYKQVYANPALYAATFFDVLFGNNSGCANQPTGTTYPCATPNPTLIPGYSATKGYDRITGIGVPFARPLIKAITGY